MFYDPRSQEHGLAHNPWNALVVPRPIGWISTRSAAGMDNLAPYSFYNTVCGKPPFVMFSSSVRKDSQTNIEETGEFVVNMAVAELAEAMNLSSATVPPGRDEFELAGLEKAPCVNVAVSRVAASPVAIECILSQVIELTTRSGERARSDVIIGEVVGIHIADHVIMDGMVDNRLLRPLARMGYMDYAIVADTFAIARPVGVE